MVSYTYLVIKKSSEMYELGGVLAVIVNPETTSPTTNQGPQMATHPSTNKGPQPSGDDNMLVFSSHVSFVQDPFTDDSIQPLYKGGFRNPPVSTETSLHDLPQMKMISSFVIITS
jgi:hypothetical protein